MDAEKYCRHCSHFLIDETEELCDKTMRPCRKVRGCTFAGKVFAKLYTQAGAEHRRECAEDPIRAEWMRLVNPASHKPCGQTDGEGRMCARPSGHFGACKGYPKENKESK